MIFRFSAFFLFGLLMLSAVGCKSKDPQSPVIARMGNVVITQDDFVQKVRALPRDVRELALQRKNDFVEDMASEQFLLQEAQRQKIDTQKDVQDLITAARRKIIVAKLLENEVDKKIQITPDDVLKYYESRRDEFMTPVLMRASHILVKTEEQAKAIKAAIDGGADFEEVARKESLDATAIRGGDLGFFQKGQFVPEFEEAVFIMKKGQISDPVRSQFGYHIIKLTDKAEPTLRDFRSVRNSIQERLLNEKRAVLLRDLLTRLKGGSKLEIDEKKLDNVAAGLAPATRS